MAAEGISSLESTRSRVAAPLPVGQASPMYAGETSRDLQMNPQGAKGHNTRIQGLPLPYPETELQDGTIETSWALSPYPGLGPVQVLETQK